MRADEGAVLVAVSDASRLADPGVSPTDAGPPVDETSVTEGLSLMRTVYGIAIVLGFQKVLQASYTRFFTGVRLAFLPWYAATLAAIAITFLAIRFFWVPRNLSSYVLGFGQHIRRVWGRVTVIHFPIALAHAVLFFYLCETVGALVTARTRVAVDRLIMQFLILCATLLIMNAIWLFGLKPRRAKVLRTRQLGVIKPALRAAAAAVLLAARSIRVNFPVTADAEQAVIDAEPGQIWAWNNLISATVLFGVAAILGTSVVISRETGLVIASAVLLANSFIDLGLTAEAYILYQDRYRRHHSGS